MSKKLDYAREILRAGRDLGITPRGIVIAFATVSVECDWIMYANAKVPESLAIPHEKVGSDGRSVGLFQQQVVWGNGWWWGDAATCMDPYKSATLFFNRLKKLDYNGPNSPGSYAQAVQGSAFPDRYDKRMAEAQKLYNQVSGNIPEPSALTPHPGFSGDPFWLADVIRAEGVKVVEVDGWKERGQGDQGVLWGVMFHHTGSWNETVEGIANHPTLGLAAHILIKVDTVYVCGIGKANHAGLGSWPGLPTDNGNPYLIGVEVAILPEDGKPHRTGWPDPLYETTVRTFAAILRKLAQNSNRAISHKEWAQFGPAGWRQGKWDPGSIDMSVFRADVQARLDRKPSGGNDMAQVPQEQWDRVYKELTQRHPSRSPLRHLGEGAVDTWAGMDLNHDGNTHVLLVERLAVEYQDPQAIALLQEVAGADPHKFPDRQQDAVLARRILDKVPTLREPEDVA